MHINPFILTSWTQWDHLLPHVDLVRSYKQKTHDLIWHEMPLSRGHWPKLHLDHHWPEIWSSWNFRMISDNTVAMLTQNTLWIAILAAYAPEKEVSGHSTLKSGSQNFLGRVEIVFTYGTEVFVATCHFLHKLVFIKWGHLIPPTSPRLNMPWLN